MTSLVRFDPWGLMRDLDRLFEGSARHVEGDWMPRADVFERDANLVVRVEVPGVDPESIEVTVEGGALCLSGERKFDSETVDGDFHRREIFEGHFKRTILLPEGTDPEAISATSKDGILEITVPKKPEVLPRKITVDVQR
jgi:HSP20 family protein